MKRSASLLMAGLLAAGAAGVVRADGDIWNEVEHGYADNDGVRIHYATVGEGPLVVMIHGFPDFWYTWRDQMDALKDDFQVAAVDQRGYNRTDQPDGVEAYDVELLASDVEAVIRHLGRESAVIVGHDWGGVVAWRFALTRPEMTDRLIVLDLPHPNGLRRLRSAGGGSGAGGKGGGYARKFREGSASDPDIFFGYPMTAENLAGWVRDDSAKAHYVEAFERSSFEGMLNYYKRNYGRSWASREEGAPPDSLPKAAMPVLMFHGLDDKFLPSDALNNTWDWLEKDLTLVTVPGAGHFVQQDAAELVGSTMKWWLLARE